MKSLSFITTIFFVALFLLTGCSSLSDFIGGKADINLSTEPGEAEVFLVQKDKSKISLGKTPLKLPANIVETNEGDSLRLLIVKKGFVTQRLFLDLYSQGRKGTINIKLEPLADWSKSYDDKEASFFLNEVASSVAAIQADIANKHLDDALRATDTLNSKFPNLSTGWVLKGNIFFLQNRQGDALAAYRKSLSIDPNNEDIKNIINKIENGDRRR